MVRLCLLLFLYHTKVNIKFLSDRSDRHLSTPESCIGKDQPIWGTFTVILARLLIADASKSITINECKNGLHLEIKPAPEHDIGKSIHLDRFLLRTIENKFKHA